MRIMKKIVFAAVMCVAVVVCAFVHEDESKPVRQGGGVDDALEQEAFPRP